MKRFFFFFLLPLLTFGQTTPPPSRVGISSRAGISATKPLQYNFFFVPEGDSVGIFAYKPGDNTTPAGPDVILGPKNERFVRTRIAGAMNFGGATYYTRSQMNSLLTEKLNKASGLSNNYIPVYNESGNQLANSALIQNDGNVGVGVTPAAKLHVAGSTRIDGNITSSGNVEQNGSYDMGRTSFNGRLTMYGQNASPPSSGTSLNGLFIMRGQYDNTVLNAGINTSQQVWLQAQDRSSLSTGRTMLLNPVGGNVVIGGTSASAKLHVAGTMTVTDTARFASAKVGDVRVAATSDLKAKTLTELRSLTTTELTARYTYTGIDGGVWQYDASDNTTADNIGTAVVTGAGKRLKRAYEKYVNPKWFGGKGDGVTNDSRALVLAMATGFVDLQGLTFAYDSTYIAPSNLRLRNGKIKFLTDANYLRFGAGSVVENVEFVGTLANTQQFVRTINGVTSYFSSPTYQDYTGASNAGSDFTHTLSGDVLTVGLPSPLTGALGRMVVSSKITLDSTKRYVIKIADNFITGNAAAPIQFWKTNVAGTEISQYIPNDTGTWLYLANAPGLKIKVSASRHDHTKLNLSCTFDLSKIEIFELTNEPAGFANNYNPEDAVNVNIYSDNVTIENCTFSYMKFASLKIVGGKNNVLRNNKIRFCVGGFTTQNGLNNLIEKNDIDLRFYDNNGVLQETGLYTRNHGVGIGYNEISTSVIGNVIKGASWAIENAEGATVSQKIAITGNQIESPHCGISACATKGTISENNIKLSALGLYGIELPTADYVTCTNNVVLLDVPAVLNYAIAGSKGLTNLLISGNTLTGNIGIQLVINTSNGDRGIVISNNNITYYTSGIFSSAGGTNIQKNIIKCFQRFHGLGVSQSSAIRIETNFYTSNVVENIIYGAASYCIFVTTPQITVIKNNTIQSFTGNYTDIYFTTNNAYTSLPTITDNLISGATGVRIAVTGTPATGSRWTLAKNVVLSGSGGTTLIPRVIGLTYPFVYFDSGIPQVTLAERTAMTLIYQGLQVYQTDGTEGVYTYKTSGWVFSY